MGDPFWRHQKGSGEPIKALFGLGLSMLGNVQDIYADRNGAVGILDLEDRHELEVLSQSFLNPQLLMYLQLLPSWRAVDQVIDIIRGYGLRAVLINGLGTTTLQSSDPNEFYSIANRLSLAIIDTAWQRQCS